MSTNISADGNTSSSSCQIQLHNSHNFDLYRTWKYSNSLARLSLAASLDFSFLSSAGLERLILGSFPERQRLVGCLPSQRQTSEEPQGASTATMHIFRQMPCGISASIACWCFCLIFCHSSQLSFVQNAKWPGGACRENRTKTIRKRGRDVSPPSYLLTMKMSNPP